LQLRQIQLSSGSALTYRCSTSLAAAVDVAVAVQRDTLTDAWRTRFQAERGDLSTL